MTLKRHGRRWVCAAILAAGGFLLAQEPPPSDDNDGAGDVVFRTETALMEVEVRATFKRGEPVEGLTRDDFQLFENGELQQIVSFDYVDYPRGEAVVARDQRLTETAGAPRATSDDLATPKPPPSEELRIFIATHIGEAEQLRVRKAVRKFVENDLPEHALVSLNGTPFIDDREFLLGYIDKAGLKDVLSGNNFTEIRPRIVMDFDSQQAVAGDNIDVDALVRGAGPNEPNETFNMFDDHMSRVRTLRYVDLIRDLSIYPGKKMIVLFSRGHSMGFDTFQRSFMGLQDADLLERLRGESMRARISMYVVDARGLEIGAVSADNRFGMENETIFSQTQFEYGAAGFVQGQTPVSAGLMDGYRGSQQGLKVLAKVTDGVAVTNSNDLGEIFDHVKKDLGGYYLIGYSPPKRENTKQIRNVKITVNREDVKLDYRNGYYDNEEFRRALAEEQRKRLEKLLGPSPSKTTDDAPLSSLTLYKTAFEVVASDTPNYVRAAEDLQRAVDEYPQFAVAWNVLGYAREQLGDPQAARDAYAKATEADPEYLQPQAHLARFDIQDEEWASAKKRSETILKADPARAEALFYLATAEYNLENLDAAREVADKVAAGPDAEKYPDVFQLLGRIHARAGDYTAASEAYRSYLEARPEAADRELVEEQIRAFETAEDVDKINAAAQEKDWQTVVELGEQLAEVDQRSGLGLYYAAMAHLELNAYPEARTTAETILSRDDSDRYPGVHRMLGTLYAREGDYDQAANHYREFIAKVPDAEGLDQMRQQLVEWEKLERYQEQTGPVVRVINPAGTTEVKVVRGPLHLIAEGPDRPMQQGDVVMRQEESVTIIESVAQDARINLSLELPYGFGFEGKSDSGDILLRGMAISGKIETATGGVEITAPWKAMRVDAELGEQPPTLTLPEGNLLETTASPDTSSVRIDDTKHPRDNTYGRMELNAAAPTRVVLRDMPVPDDAVVKMPWQAPGILEEIVNGEPKKRRAGDAPTLRNADGLGDDAVRFSSEVRMVSLAVSVATEDGTPVTDLDQSSFEVVEAGAPQEIVSVTSGDAPFNMAVLLDLSASTIEDRTGMKLVARRFVGAARPEDRIGVYTLGNEVFTVAAPLNSDREVVAQRIDALPPMAGGSPLYDSIVLAYNEELRGRAGQRNALVIISDGMDSQLAALTFKPIPEKKRTNKRWLEYQARAEETLQDLLAAGSAVKFEDLHQAAGRMETLIYPFIVSRSASKTEQPIVAAARANMEALATASGGRVFHATMDDEVDPFREVTEELRSVYTVAYYPKNQTFSGEWRPVEVKVNKPGVKVRTREGYTAR